MFSPQLKKGSVELLVLSILEENTHHGYEIGKQIEARSAGHLQFRISSLYPVLRRLEKRQRYSTLALVLPPDFDLHAALYILDRIIYPNHGGHDSETFVQVNVGHGICPQVLEGRVPALHDDTERVNGALAFGLVQGQVQ